MSLLTLLKARGSTTLVRSVQQVTITIAANATSGTATISSVDTTKSLPLSRSQSTDNTTTSAAEVFARVELTNATTVTAYRNTASATNTVTVIATIIEFTAAAVNSVQTGTIAITGTSNTATISAVTTGVPVYLGLTTTQTVTAANTLLATVELTNSTTVTAARDTSSADTVTVGYAVIDCKAALVNSVQRRSVTLTSALTADTDTISGVTASNTILIPNGSTSATTGHTNSQYTLGLTNGTTVTLTRGGTSTSSRTIKYTALEFASGVLRSLQRATTAFSTPPQDDTVTAVGSRAFVNPVGAATGSVSNWSQVHASAALQGATTVRLNKTGTGVTSTVSYEVAEFA